MHYDGRSCLNFQIYIEFKYGQGSVQPLPHCNPWNLRVARGKSKGLGLSIHEISFGHIMFILSFPEQNVLIHSVVRISVIATWQAKQTKNGPQGLWPDGQAFLESRRRRSSKLASARRVELDCCGEGVANP